jgi:hypothetical protein
MGTGQEGVESPSKLAAIQLQLTPAHRHPAPKHGRHCLERRPMTLKKVRTLKSCSPGSQIANNFHQVGAFKKENSMTTNSRSFGALIFLALVVAFVTLTFVSLKHDSHSRDYKEFKVGMKANWN